MNIPYIIENYPFRSHLITDKDIREAAFPIHMILQTLRYVVQYHEKLDPDFVMPEDDKVTIWIDKLETAKIGLNVLNLLMLWFMKSWASSLSNEKAFT